MKVNNIFGSPIFKNGNDECCYYADEAVSKKEAAKFPVCRCPVREYYMKQNHVGMIISCSEKAGECSIKSSQSIKDIKIIQAYIEKYKEGNWCSIPVKHWNKLRDSMLSLSNDEYLHMLFKYFGFYQVVDEHVEGIVMCAEKLKMEIA